MKKIYEIFINILNFISLEPKKIDLIYIDEVVVMNILKHEKESKENHEKSYH